MKLRRSLFWLLTQLLPPACPLCRQTFPAHWQEPFCSDCLTGFQPLPAAHCTCCALPFTAVSNSAHLCGRCLDRPPIFAKVHTVGCFDSSLREAIHQFKFNQRVGLDRPLGIMLNKFLPVDAVFELIVPVPLHSHRLRQRSYNQSLLLARELARLRSSPIVPDLLIKTENTVSQQELSARDRERNLSKVFQVQGPLRGERVLLVDDVMTTGSTVRACSQALLAAGAREVQVAVVGRA